MTDQEREFCGLFAGEGCIHIVKQKRVGRWASYFVRLSISQRMDNLGLLLWLRDHFGGRIVGRRHDRRGTWSATWQLAVQSQVKYCLRLLLQSSIPSVKQPQAQLALEFTETTRRPGRCGPGAMYTAEEQAVRAAMYEQMKQSKRFDLTKATSYKEGPIQ